MSRWLRREMSSTSYTTIWQLLRTTRAIITTRRSMASMKAWLARKWTLICNQLILLRNKIIWNYRFRMEGIMELKIRNLAILKELVDFSVSSHQVSMPTRNFSQVSSPKRRSLECMRFQLRRWIRVMKWTNPRRASISVACRSKKNNFKQDCWWVLRAR